MPTCEGPSTVVFDQALAEYDFGPSHPMSPLRVDLTMRLATALGVVGPGATSGLRLAAAPVASNDLIATVHDPRLIEAVERAGRTVAPDERHGLGTDDNPVFRDMHRAAAHVVGASVEAFRQVWAGEVLHAANITGGLHHAMPDRAAGFCIYNDVAVGIKHLLDNGAERVAYVDIDVHHGDGVERVFWDDPRVLTISLHETGQMLFPGTGFAEDVGGREAQGYAVNLALPPGTSDAGWLRAFHAVVPPLLREFDPQVLVTQHGCDSHAQDPLAHLMLSIDGQRAAYLALHDLAHEVAGGRWVVTGGGGYALVEVVPRAWTHLLAIVGGAPLDPATETPGEWREHVKERLERTAPSLMTDGRTPAYRDWREGYDPDTWLDRAIHATRMATFPLHGLDPMP
ncbi:acetoin utilization protein AcuC [Nocardioides marmotae]|uniref:Acetoin utilization protein AcuC n=1 Tax=Nocardioides marmotae TaxID=2663857 RepID=A0A6I3J434_9ACTN|nr:acetoin utilization protein AcuC [Nocardioides marmotae]MCR6029994.1 acetoin utilization protein AcuC [Gordonia jinghuaiqii]MBC9732950.1 acetoin utilization protein AcuC [Nocardioides marmotae]MTB84064.1 acetoin utilization protein AcuC [Nocardioides marmotae]MTB93624.1 acetoin utilization protein AcuC [Nocardioides marmotae]QKD99982.1 acetoin utilization protein AcuC [Nocardioides marmotae]